MKNLSGFNFFNFRTLGEEAFDITLPSSEDCQYSGYSVIGTIIVQWRRVGRLNLSSARANSLAGLSTSELLSPIYVVHRLLHGRRGDFSTTL